jgi:hypothetical protein
MIRSPDFSKIFASPLLSHYPPACASVQTAADQIASPRTQKGLGEVLEKRPMSVAVAAEVGV